METINEVLRPYFNPKNLGSQLANTWPKITAHEVYAMVRNGSECKTLDFPRWLQLWKRQTLTFFAGRLIRNAEVRGSNPFCPTKLISFSYLARTFLLKFSSSRISTRFSTDLIDQRIRFASALEVPARVMRRPGYEFISYRQCSFRSVNGLTLTT